MAALRSSLTPSRMARRMKRDLLDSTSAGCFFTSLSSSANVPLNGSLGRINLLSMVIIPLYGLALLLPELQFLGVGKSLLETGLAVTAILETGQRRVEELLLVLLEVRTLERDDPLDLLGDLGVQPIFDRLGQLGQRAPRNVSLVAVIVVAVFLRVVKHELVDLGVDRAAIGLNISQVGIQAP